MSRDILPTDDDFAQWTPKQPTELRVEGEPMTVAVDIKTGAVVGQVIGRGPREPIRQIHGAYMPPAWEGEWLRLLTKDGYTTVPAASVRLEKV